MEWKWCLRLQVCPNFLLNFWMDLYNFWKTYTYHKKIIQETWRVQLIKIYMNCWEWRFKGIVKWAEPWKCVILLVSRIFWHKRINTSLREWRFWYLILIGHFASQFLVYAAPAQWRLLIYIRKNLWHRVLKANKKQVPLKNCSLEIRIDSVNQILKNKEKVK